MKLKLLAIATAAALAVSAQAHAVTVYNFWFDNVEADNGNVDGTVYGKIYGLGDNGSFNATDVVIVKNPGVVGLPSTPFTVADYAADIGQFINENFFIITNQHVDFAVYQIWGGWFDMNIQCCGHGFNSLVGPDGLTRVQNWEGMDGLRFAAAPEPSSWAMMLAGFGGLGALMRRRRAMAAPA